jgi:hypothetical protein
MTIDMNDSGIVTLEQLKRFLAASKGWKFKGLSREDKYQWIEATVRRFDYFSLGKADKGLVRKYIMLATGFSRAQMNRLLSRKLYTGAIKELPCRRNRFRTIYTRGDIELLAETDNLHERMSGPATKVILKRQHEQFKEAGFERLKGISSAHIYNLRESPAYKVKAITVGKTKSVQNTIGVRGKPNPGGKPGHLRVDTVHQGDSEKAKGVYSLNLVDEVTQWEVVACVEGINEDWMDEVLNAAMTLFPFRIRGFHSDNGSEFVNKHVAKMLGEQFIRQSKSRSGRTNDNALVEGKNGSVIRKHMGHWHIACGYAPEVNRFYMGKFNVYLNYHRPCGFATVTVDEKGKRHRNYEVYQTPYEALKMLPNAAQYLKEGVTFEQLDRIAMSESDNECARLMQKEKLKLFRKVQPAGLNLFQKGGLATNTRRDNDE